MLSNGKLQKNNGESIFNVEAKTGSQTFGIAQSPFMLDKAKTKAFKMNLSVTGDELSYHEVTSLPVYGKDFEHTDQSTLSCDIRAGVKKLTKASSDCKNFITVTTAGIRFLNNIFGGKSD